MSSIFIVAALAARGSRFVSILDITGAYLNASMPENVEVYMRLDSVLAEELVKLDPSYKNFRNKNGTVIVRLLKALYGCIESAKLWFKHIERSLNGLGFTPNQVDLCLFNKGGGKDQVTVVIYVDDLLITCRDDAIKKQVIESIEGIYNSITVSEGKSLSYLGMTFNFSNEGEVIITMDKYINEIINEYNVKGFSATPATNDLFKINESEQLNQESKMEYH